MKFLIALIIIIPTLISALLFTVAALACKNPAMLAATANPSVAVLCVIAGVITILPLCISVVIGLGNMIGALKTKKRKKHKSTHR